MTNIFIVAAKLHESATLAGNSDEANKAYLKMKAFCKNKENLQSIVELLNHEDPAIQIWAASFLKQKYPEIVKITLKKILAANIPIHSFSAEMMLAEQG